MHRIASMTFVGVCVIALGLPGCGAKTSMPTDGGGTGGAGGTGGVTPGTGGSGGSATGGAGGGTGGAGGTAGAGGRGGSGGAGGAGTGGATGDAGIPVSMCPVSPQGKPCMMGSVCTAGTAGMPSGGCACPAGTWVCPTIPDGGIMACPANARTGVPCTMSGAFCLGGGDGGASGCLCNGSGALMVWTCIGR
jgi:hypothetical protein